MEKKTGKIDVSQIYVSRLAKILVHKEDGSMRWEAPPKPQPTGIAEVDALAALLAKTPVPSRGILARAAGDMPGRLYRETIRYRTGLKYTEFITRYRVMLAEELLRCTDVSLREVLRLSGLSQQMLQLLFNEQYGLPPLTYRRYRRPDDYRHRYRYDG